MKNTTPNVLSVVTLLGALLVIVAISYRNEGWAYAPAAATEFEPVGEEVGWNGLPVAVRHLPTGIVLRLIAPGEFLMGSPETEAERDGDERRRPVAVRSGFYLGETEVTIAQWLRVMESLPIEIEHDGLGALPVQGVSWTAAQAFVARLNETSAGQWRLPSEVEWEYACRAGTTTAFAFGDNVTTAQVNFDGRRPYSDGAPAAFLDRPVAARSLPPNAWGLYEMHGNVTEWCEDLYVVHPSIDTADEAAGASRVLRGGDWSARARDVRSASRDGYPPSSSGAKYGLRVALSIPAPR